VVCILKSREKVVYASGLCFEYGFRNIVNLLNPERKEHEKDRAAKEYLGRGIKEEGIEAKDILKCIWSYNPFWIRKGYNPFGKPTLVWPNDY